MSLKGHEVTLIKTSGSLHNSNFKYLLEHSGKISLIENIQRQDLNSIEEANAYKKLISEFNLTQEELSKRLGKSRTAITNTMRLLNLSA